MTTSSKPEWEFVWLGGLWKTTSGKSIKTKITTELVQKLQSHVGDTLLISARKSEKKTEKDADYNMSAMLKKTTFEKPEASHWAQTIAQQAPTDEQDDIPF